MCDLQTTNHQRINCLMIIELVADKILLYIVNKHHCHLFATCTTLINLFTVTANNNTMYSKNRNDYRIVRSKLAIIVFQINTISESEGFRETSNNT